MTAEKNRISLYLHRSSERAVLEVAEVELLGKHESALLENQTSGVQALLRNEKFDDLARVFRLYSRLPNGLQTVSRIFKQHVQEQGLAIVRSREAAIAAAGGKESSSDPTFVRALLELHDKAKTVRCPPRRCSACQALVLVPVLTVAAVRCYVDRWWSSSSAATRSSKRCSRTPSSCSSTR